MTQSPEDSALFFSEAYAQASTDEHSYFNPERRAAVAELQLALINTLPVTDRHLLDLGGGNGYFARRAAAAGWQVVLVDPALDPRDFTGSGVKAIRGTAAEIIGSHFDVVTAWDVIEHVPHPDKFLRDAVTCLQPGGRLVLETGNYKSAERAEEGPTHWIHQADHRWYFAPDSLGSLMEVAGLVNIELHPCVLRPGWSGNANYAGPSRLQTMKAILRQPAQMRAMLLRHNRLSRSSRSVGAGLSIFTMLGKRPEPN